jgi:hypothetical protein
MYNYELLKSLASYKITVNTEFTFPNFVFFQDLLNAFRDPAQSINVIF